MATGYIAPARCAGAPTSLAIPSGHDPLIRFPKVKIAAILTVQLPQFSLLKNESADRVRRVWRCDISHRRGALGLIHRSAASADTIR